MTQPWRWLKRSPKLYRKRLRSCRRSAVAWCYYATRLLPCQPQLTSLQLSNARWVCEHFPDFAASNCRPARTLEALFALLAFLSAAVAYLPLVVGPHWHQLDAQPALLRRIHPERCADRAWRSGRVSVRGRRDRQPLQGTALFQA